MSKIMEKFPEKMDKHLSAVRHWPDGTAVIATSSLAGKYWTGSVWCYKQATDVPDISKCITGLETDSGICDIVPLGRDRVFVGLDSGGVEILVRDKGPDVLKSEFYCNEHDDLVISVDVSCDLSKGVSGSYDYGIKVWCLESFTTIHAYRQAHSNLIQCVTFSDINSDTFLSCGLDGRITMWDTRLSQPATLLGGTIKQTLPTAMACQPGSNCIAVGFDTGQISLFDVRQNGRPTGIWQAHNRRVHRVTFSPANPNILASCADEFQVIVSEVGQESPKVIYRKELHEDFVRGLSWHPQSNVLYSCGWDTRVFVHSLSPDS